MKISNVFAKGVLEFFCPIWSISESRANASKNSGKHKVLESSRSDDSFELWNSSKVVFWE